MEPLRVVLGVEGDALSLARNKVFGIELVDYNDGASRLVTPTSSNEDEVPHRI
jgi:hypothetical protein